MLPMSFNRFKAAWRASSVLSQTLRSVSTVTKDTKIGIVGCGNVGKAVANNLVRSGFNVTCAYDAFPSQMEEMPKGIGRCSSSREVAENTDVIVSGLPRPVNVLEAADGPEGLLAGLSKDKVWIDHSTTDYDNTLRFSKEASQVGAHVIEAPITGGLSTLKKGNMVVYVGGDEQVAEAVRPILDASYLKIFYSGDIGTAMTLKVVSNMLAGVHLLAMTEVLLLAKKQGFDLKRFWEGIRLSAGHSFIWDTGAPFVFSRQFEPGFTMELMCKDLQLGYEMARKYRVPMDINQLTMSIFRRAQYQCGDEAACYIPPKMLEESIGTDLEERHFRNWTYENEIVNDALVVKHSGIEDGYDK